MLTYFLLLFTCYTVSATSGSIAEEHLIQAHSIWSLDYPELLRFVLNKSLTKDLCSGNTTLTCGATSRERRGRFDTITCFMVKNHFTDGDV